MSELPAPTTNGPVFLDPETRRLLLEEIADLRRERSRFRALAADEAAVEAHRHRKALAMPDWSATELAELSPGLRGLVIAGLFDRDLLRRRLRFRARGLTPQNHRLAG